MYNLLFEEKCTAFSWHVSVSRHGIMTWYIGITRYHGYMQMLYDMVHWYYSVSWLITPAHGTELLYTAIWRIVYHRPRITLHLHMYVVRYTIEFDELKHSIFACALQAYALHAAYAHSSYKMILSRQQLHSEHPHPFINWKKMRYAVMYIAHIMSVCTNMYSHDLLLTYLKYFGPYNSHFVRHYLALFFQEDTVIHSKGQRRVPL